jgi:hypothetical protein
LANLAIFHSVLALATKRCFVAHKVLYNFYFGRFLTFLQSLVIFFTKDKREEIRESYSDPRGSRARPPRVQGGQAPLSRALPRTGHAAAWLRGAAVKWTRPRRTHPFSSMFPLSGRFVFFSSPNSDDPSAPSNSPRSFPFQSTRALHQLRKVLGFRLRPRAQALPFYNSAPTRSSPNPAGAPPRAPHRGQRHPELFRRCFLLLWNRGELLMLLRCSIRVLLKCGDQCSFGRGGRPPRPWPGPLE